MVNVAHDRDDRRAALQMIVDVLVSDEADFNVRFRHSFRRVTEFLYDQFSRIDVDHVRDLVHCALFHQIFDDVDGAFRHAVR